MSNVVSFKKPARNNSPNFQCPAQVSELLYAMVVFSTLDPDLKKLQMVRDVFSGGVTIDSDRLTVPIPFELAEAISEIESHTYGSAAGLMQRMVGGKSISEALADRLRDQGGAQ